MEKIKEWLGVDGLSGWGSGCGWGDGSGYGDGDGDGSGWGWGDGSGDGSGSGYGYGSGWGCGSESGIKSLNGQAVHLIDRVQTIVVSVHMNLAKGFILNGDLTLAPCYVAKGNGVFAHGETPAKAQEALQEKILESMDTDEAVEKFCEAFEVGERYAGHEFFKWHHYLTGSCEMGRKSFVQNHNIDLDKLYTVEEFVALTENDYGGEAIRKVKERYE